MNIKSVYVEITNQCNLNCRSCYNRSGTNRKRKELSAGELEHIITQFRPYGLERFLISGGEPTLHTEFDSILALIDKYPEISFGIVTNATTHNPKLIEYINTRNNLTLQISLDGSCEEENAKTRGYGQFEKAISFAGKIHRDNPKPLLKMVVSQRNFTDVEAFCRLALSIGFTPELAFLYKSGNGSDSWEDQRLTPRQKLHTLRQLDAINQKYHADAFLPLCTGTCPFTSKFHNLSLCIKTDGSIQPCQMLYENDFSLGNVLFFDEKLFLQRLNNISDMAKERTRQDFGCTKCLLKSCCGKGCMAEAFHLYNDPLADDGNCEYRKLQFLYHQIK